MNSPDVYNVSPEQFDRNARNILFSIGQLANIVPTEEMIEEYKSKLLESGRINILKNNPALTEQTVSIKERAEA